jgi:hypothetical protein
MRPAHPARHDSTELVEVRRESAELGAKVASQYDKLNVAVQGGEWQE